MNLLNQKKLILEKLLQEPQVVKTWIKKYVSFILKTTVVKVGERHHILPKSIFKDYKKEEWNIRNISSYDHVKAHYLLYKAFPKRKEMCYSFLQMVGRFDKDHLEISFKEYEKAKNISREFRRQEKLGHKQSEETIQKRVSKVKGQKRTPEQRERISKALTGIKRKPMSSEQKEFLRNFWLGRKRTKQNKRNVSKGLTGLKKTPEHIENLRKTRIGRKLVIMPDGKKYFKFLSNNLDTETQEAENVEDAESNNP